MTKVTINGNPMSVSEVKPKHIQGAKCWECKRKYDAIFHDLNGIAGRCHACDAKRWIVSPENYKKLKNKKLKAVM